MTLRELKQTTYAGSLSEEAKTLETWSGDSVDVAVNRDDVGSGSERSHDECGGVAFDDETGSDENETTLRTDC